MTELRSDGGWSRARRLAAVFGVVSWLLAAIDIMLRSGFGRGDLRAFALWSGLACLLAVLPLRWFGRWTVAWPSALTLSFAVCAGIGFAALITYGVALWLGPWVEAFDFPIFLCWTGGASATFLLSAVLADRRRWPFAAILWPASLAALQLSLALARPASPPEYVVLAPAGSWLRVEAVWELLSVPSTATQSECDPSTIRGVSAFQEGNRPGVLVTFHPGTSAVQRAAVMDRLVGSPKVAVVRERETGKDGRLHERVLKDAKP